jgi:hypothetical protein
MGRGGLQNGWGGIADGYLLNLTSPANGSRNYYDGVGLGMVSVAKRNYVRFRAWVWVESGSFNTFWVSIVDSGTSITIPNYNTWTYVDQLIGMSPVVTNDLRINWLYQSDTRPINYYFGLIHVTLPEGTGDSSQHPSSSL